MKINEIQDLINFINQSGLEEVNIETEQIKICVRRTPPVTQQIVAHQEAVASTQQFMPTSTIPSGTNNDHSQQKVSSNYITIKSPMIGTFYQAASPNAPPLVKIGDSLQQGSKVCIIEAMKLFNEIESEVTGTVVEILVKDATPIEYDQPLFVVDPS